MEPEATEQGGGPGELPRSTRRTASARPRRGRASPLTSYLIIALLIPLSVALLNSVAQLRSALRTERAAATLGRRIADLELVSRLYLPMASEQVVFYGLASIDELHLDRALISNLFHVDLASYAQSARTKMDDRLAALAKGFGAAKNVAASGELSTLRDQLAALRTRLDERTATVTEATHLFAGMSSWVERRVQQGVGDVERIGDPMARTRAVIDMVADAAAVRRTGAAEAVAAFDLLTRRPTATNRAVVAAADDHLAALHALGHQQVTATSIAQLRATKNYQDWLEQITIMRALPGDAGLVVSQDTPTSPVAGQMAAFVNAHMRYLEALDVAVSQEMERQSQAARVLADNANTNRWRTIGVVAATLGSLFASILLVRRGVVRPLVRLAEHGEALHEGVEPSAPLPLRGPREIRVATDSFNGLVGTFGSVRRAVAALAAGRAVEKTPEDADEEQVPGPLGEALRSSVSNLEAMTAELHHSQAFASAIVDHAADAIWTVDTAGHIVTANPAAGHLLGVDADVQVGQPIGDFLHRVKGELCAVSPAGKATPVLTSWSTSKVGEVEIRTVVAHDITERRELEVQLFHQARHDSLTGLNNRSAILEYLVAALDEEDVKTSVMFVDIDGFKAVNDTNGHAVGDRVLTVVAERLRRLTTTGMVARLGGDEFLIVGPAPSTTAELRQAASALVNEVERPIRLGENLFSLSASVGVTVTRPGETDAAQIMRRADEAAYVAKERGGGRVEMYNADLQAMIERRSAVDLGVRHAVRSGELELLLQPMVDLRDGSYPVFEALVRWRRNGELISASAFIPIAERSSAIVEIGRWTLGQSCAVLSRWQHDENLRGRRLAVNVSGRHLMDEDFVDDVRAALRSHSVPASLLELELTETHLLTDLPRVRRSLQTLEDEGVSVVVDDFGSGFASMTYLSTLQPEVVKLDKAFVADVQTNATNQAIVAALISIGQVIGFDVVAEGVETAEQLRYLARHGCRRAQGFLVAPPMPVPVCERWLAEGSPSTLDLGLLVGRGSANRAE